MYHNYFCPTCDLAIFVTALLISTVFYSTVHATLYIQDNF